MNRVKKTYFLPLREFYLILNTVLNARSIIHVLWKSGSTVLRRTYRYAV